MEPKEICFLLLLCHINWLTAQIKIGDNPQDIDTASVLELQSTTRAFVLTRVSTDEMMAITPLQGALVYNVSEECVYYFNGGQWNNLCTGVSDLSFMDNGNGTYTIDIGNGPITFSGVPESITTIKNNDNGTYTYTAEDGQETLIQTGILEGEHIGIPGSVFFANSSSGAPFEANDDFFWDNTNKRLGIGTNTPTNDLHVDGIMRSGRISNSQGTTAFPSYHFTGSFDTGMFSPSTGSVALVSAGREVLRVTPEERVGIKVTNPQATLHVGGDLIVDGSIITGGGTVINKKANNIPAIRRLTSRIATLTEIDKTLIVEGSVARINLPIASVSNKGHLFLIKDLGGELTKFDIPYRDYKNELVFTTIEKGVLWLQSDGSEWHQVN